MPQVPMTDFADGMQVHDTDLDPLRLNISDHETRMLAVEAMNTTQNTDISTINTKLGAVTTGNPVHNRLNSLETLTGGATSGNVALDSRLGSGVGTGSNVTTGSASSQLADLRSRATSLETVIGGTVYSNAAQSFGAGPTKMTFNVATGTGMPARAPSGITWNDANDEFTIVSAGWYTVSVCMVFDASVSATIQFAPAAPTAANTYYISAIGAVNAAGASFPHFFNVGEIVRVYVGTTPGTANTLVGWSRFSIYRGR